MLFCIHLTNIGAIQKGNTTNKHIMCHSTEIPDHRERLAEKIRARTNDGDDILHYLFGVFYDQDDPKILHGHRLQATRMLVRHGHLSPFALEMVREMPSDTGRKADRAEARSDSKMAERIRRMTNDGDDIVDYLLSAMNGIGDTGKKRICHNTRLAAARELLKRGYDYGCVHDAAESVPARIESEAAAESSQPATENPELITDNSEMKIDEEEPVDYLAIVKRVVESLGPIEEEEEDDSGYQPDYSMWDMIEYPPLSEISDEHARIGAALFHEAVERSRLWKQSNVKIPTREDHNDYDDG